MPGGVNPLPIDEHIPEIVARLRRSRRLVIEAPPGAGKTTRVPPALAAFGDVLVLEPRRLAARMAARRVAAERAERVGESVGYAVRFEQSGGRRTRLWFLTEGVLIRRMVAEPALGGIGVVVLDEFHERHLDGDLALALLRRLGVRIVVMSATLDGAAVAGALGCERVRSEGRIHGTEIRYTPQSSQTAEERIAEALEGLVREGLDGHVLVFVPGAAEIRRAMRACEGIAARAGLALLPLHGDLAPEDQDRAVGPSDKWKVILSTNVAESSVTIEGVSVVIDTGLARVARDDPWTGLPALAVARISRASADQRAGRAGRTRAGRVVRLYPEADYARLAGREPPEILRRELSRMCLDIAAMGSPNLEWLDAPPPASVEVANALLVRLGAVADGGITAPGRRMAELPLHPRLARLVLEGGNEARLLAAWLSSGERLPPDVLDVLEREPPPAVRKIDGQLAGLKPGAGSKGRPTPVPQAVLAAFPDRVMRHPPGGKLVVAVDAEQRGSLIVRSACAIEPEWLVDLFPDRVREERRVSWNRERESVEAASALVYDGVVLEESPSTDIGAEGAALLFREAARAGWRRFAEDGVIEAWLARVAFVARHAAVRRIEEADIVAALESLCEGCVSFAELRRADLAAAVRERLTREQRRRVDEYAPERLPIGRRMVNVHYRAEGSPWIASRLQDFFGLRETPRVARGAVPVVVHLLAPNQRPVQMTTDLAGFWDRLYPQVRRELMRRYPKHSWPERP
ncbi:MAG: ATP-dependent helicase C-terminal domain-containing protein [Bryobacteraceae bacterium]